MKNLSYIAGEITKNKNLEENLVKFGNSLSTLYSGLAYIKLSMNYYTFHELLAEQPKGQAGGAMKTLLRLAGETERMLGEMTSSEGRVPAWEEAQVIRGEIIKEMGLITGIVDRLRIYEFVLNRVEYRFDETPLDADYYNSGLTNDLMHYILSDKDSVVVNTKIAEVIAQLPMRLTRNKFFEYLKDAFSLYKGAQRGTLRDFVYSLSTVAMIPPLPDFDTEFPQVYAITKQLQNADFKQLSGEEFKRLQGLLTLAAQEMEDCADLFVMLAMVVNDLYTIVLARGSAFEDVKEVYAAKRALFKVLHADGAAESMDEEMMELFEGMEGKQEKISMSVDACDYVVEYALDNCHEGLEATGMLPVYKALGAILRLQSGSTFVSLNEDKTALEIITDEALDEAFAELAGQLDGVFKSYPQAVNRAIMAAVLGQLPVFFNNLDEIQEYINGSLGRCSDEAEQKACVEIMKMIMDDGN